MFVLLFLNGWFQGMGWLASGRTMVHWWSQKERGGIVSIWNCAHNVGGGMIGPLFILGMGWFNDWRAAFTCRRRHRRRHLRLPDHARHPAVLRPAAGGSL